jgi:hypothetical protein
MINKHIPNIQKLQIFAFVSMALVSFGCQTSPFKVDLYKLKDPELVQLSQNFLYHYYLSLYVRNQRAMTLKDCDRIRAHSSELLLLNEKFKDDWNYGNVVLTSNLYLGTCEVWQNHDSSALKYLKAASLTPGSPQLNSFGPDRDSFILATELLKKGYQKEVLGYLESIEKHWVAEFSGQKISSWKKEIQLGKIPDFTKWAK